MPSRTILFALLPWFLLNLGAVAASETLIFFGDRNLPPYEFLEQGVPKGANVDLAQAIGRVLGRPVEVRLMDWAEAQERLRVGAGHALTMLGQTDEREPLYEFSRPTLPVSLALFVRADRQDDLGIDRLQWRRVGVTRGGLPRDFFEANHPEATLMYVDDFVDGTKALADAHQLELAVLNLAVNARDAMPEGGVLTIAVEEETIGKDGFLPSGRYIRLCLGDTGTGMDAATLRRATEPFFTTKEVGKGTGLGLSMVHGLAEQSGGRFVLHSESGRGTTAEMLLPVAAAQAEPVRPRAISGNTKDMPPPANLSVLAVDDDALVLMGTAGMLEDLGHVSVEAGSGAEALEILQSGRPVDVVVTDQAMPGMTGLQLAVALREQWPGLPVILATGFADLPDGANGVVAVRLAKPFRQDNLAAALARAVETAEKVVPFRPRQG